MLVLGSCLNKTEIGVVESCELQGLLVSGYKIHPFGLRN
jgi:hypothetical protein